MSSEPVTSSPPAVPGPRARKLRTQRMMNLIVRGLLRTPLVCRGVGNLLVTLYIVGRKSGRRYTVPVAYTRHEGALLIGTPFGWGRNLRTGQTLKIRLKGRLQLADVQVMTDEQDVTAAYAIICRDNHNFARFNKVGFDTDGNPDPADLRLAWTAGARAIRLRVR